MFLCIVYAHKQRLPSAFVMANEDSDGSGSWGYVMASAQLQREYLEHSGSIRKKGQKEAKNWKTGKQGLWNVFCTFPMQLGWHSGRGWLPWACARLSQSTVNHALGRASQGAWLPCWTMGYWWILGDGQPLFSSGYPRLQEAKFQPQGPQSLGKAQ